ncbi:MAG: type IV toxin-antitoxin system AbiEi family antitoxin domain-containing protein [Rhodothermales bacterium]
MDSAYHHILQLARERGVISARDLAAHDLPRRYLTRLADRGELERVARGLYALPDRESSAYHDIAITARRVPDAVCCLLTALHLHEMTTHIPFEVWLALPHRAWEPTPDSVPLRTVRMNETTYTAGVEVQELERVTVRVFEPAKTVADCFKYRSLVGLDVALDALAAYQKRRSASERWSPDRLWHFAEITRMQRVMRPYLEAFASGA